jgi:hypothetical protein
VKPVAVLTHLNNVLEVPLNVFQHSQPVELMKSSVIMEIQESPLLPVTVNTDSSVKVLTVSNALLMDARDVVMMV